MNFTKAYGGSDRMFRRVTTDERVRKERAHRLAQQSKQEEYIKAIEEENAELKEALAILVGGPNEER